MSKDVLKYINTLPPDVRRKLAESNEASAAMQENQLTELVDAASDAALNLAVIVHERAEHEEERVIAQRGFSLAVAYIRAVHAVFGLLPTSARQQIVAAFMGGVDNAVPQMEATFQKILPEAIQHRANARAQKAAALALQGKEVKQELGEAFPDPFAPPSQEAADQFAQAVIEEARKNG